MFTRNFLKELRGKVLRRKLWYKVLSDFDRCFYNLTCTVVDRVDSLELGREILGLVIKLKNALKGDFVRFIETIGVRRAWGASECAVAWGYSGAGEWKHDSSLVRLLALNEYNVFQGGFHK